MFELPSYDGVEEVVVNGEVVEGRAQPLVIYAEKKAARARDLEGTWTAGLCPRSVRMMDGRGAIRARCLGGLSMEAGPAWACLRIPDVREQHAAPFRR